MSRLLHTPVTLCRLVYHKSPWWRMVARRTGSLGGHRHEYVWAGDQLFDDQSCAVLAQLKRNIVWRIGKYRPKCILWINLNKTYSFIRKEIVWVYKIAACPLGFLFSKECALLAAMQWYYVNMLSFSPHFIIVHVLAVD